MQLGLKCVLTFLAERVEGRGALPPKSRERIIMMKR